MKKPIVRLTAFGKSKSIPEWSDEFNVPIQNIWARLQHQWDPERAVSEPVNQRGKRLSTVDFIIRVKEVHGSTYRYGNSRYRTNKEKVVITCQIHGDFKQLPIHHFSGHGCPKCGHLKRVNKLSVTP